MTAVIGSASPARELLNLNQLNELAFETAWLKYLSAPDGFQDVEGYQGVSGLLVKPFSLKPESMLHNDTLPSRASRSGARFLGELISFSVLEADVSAIEDIAGKFVKTENRIVVIAGVATTLAVLLFLAACYALSMLWFSSSHRQFLNLDSDPAALVGVALFSKST